MAMPTKKELSELSLDELTEAYPKMDPGELITLKQGELNDYKPDLLPEDIKVSTVHLAKEEDQKRRLLRDNSKGSVITEIDLSWSNAFWLAFQFIVVLNILMIPIAFIYLMIFNILY